VLVADPQKIFKTLNWKPKFNSLEKIIQHAWNWEVKSTNNGRIVKRCLESSA
jgi:UDP-glucose 4-epimerase